MDRCRKCRNPVYARGLCLRHYFQEKRSGELRTTDDMNEARADLLWWIMDGDPLTTDDERKEHGY